MFKRLFNILVLVALSLGLSACAKVYVDNSLGDPDYASFKKSANPQPIQVLFEFQTEGVSNAGGTISARPKVLEEISKSGMFSSVSSLPVASGRKLMILIQNIGGASTSSVDPKKVQTKISFTYPTSTAIDGYICKMTYIEPGHANTVTEVKHSLFSTIGDIAGPSGLEPMTITEAFDKVLRQMVGRSLRNLAAASDLAK
jgi:hypothetical protein